MEQETKEVFLLTAHYPFGYGETFLEDEFHIIGQIQSLKITIISCERGPKVERRYLPEQTEVICSRKHRYDIGSLLLAMLQMVCPKTWKEISFARKILGYRKNFISIAKKIYIYYYISAELTRTLEKMDIPEDAILYSYWMTEEAYFLSKYKQKHPNLTCVCRTHGSDCFIDKFYQPFRREILGKLDAVFPISEVGKSSIETLLVPHVVGKVAPLVVQRLGVEKQSDRLNPTEESNVFCIVTCSNVIELKRLDLLIDALAMIEVLKIQWIHFGDGVLMDSIQHRAKEKLKSGNIDYHFLGHVPKAEILKWYETNHVDVFVNCSDSEGIPVSIMEAFAYGIPAIARNVGGVRELVMSGYNGELLPTECTSNMLKEAILSMARNSEDVINSLRVGAYSTYENTYCAEQNYEKFYKQIKQIGVVEQ